MYRVDQQQQDRVEPIIPPIAPPRGVKFFVGTWSGRFILINTVLFVIISLQSGSFIMPDSEVLLRWGAKDNVLLAQGEFWRLLTPVFIHIGLMHYAFNNWALYVLGYQLEYLLKSKWYFILYLVAGVAGNVASSLFSLSISAGASSSLFGILGAGFLIERKIGALIEQQGGGRGRKTGVFAGMVLINLVLGFVIPQIDNAAHLGGLLSGVVFTYALLKLQPNRLMGRQPRHGWAIMGLLGIFLAVGVALSCSSRYTKYRIGMAAADAQEPSQQFFYLSQLLRLDENDVYARFKRLRLSLFYDEYEMAAKDVSILLGSGQVSADQWNDLSTELNRLGQGKAASWLRQRLENKAI